MIELQQLSKQYGLNPVLRGVNWHIAAGEFVGLVGSNGAGKSTLLRIVATLLTPTSGIVKVGGWPLPTHSAQVRRHIGLISHHPLLYSDLTAGENLHFFARLYGVERPEERIAHLLQTVGLYPRQHDFVRTFSRGMLQRLAIARATLHNPDVLLLDEPYTGLDPAAMQLLDTLLLEQTQLGRTILLITHDLIHGLNLCQRIAILHKGKIVEEVKQGQLTAGEFVGRYQEITRA